MHFRKIVATVIRDFVGHKLQKSPLTVTPDEFELFLNTVRCRSQLVNNIFLILFKNLPRHKEIREFVECWTRNPKVLIGVTVTLTSNLQLSKLIKNVLGKCLIQQLNLITPSFVLAYIQ